MIGVLIYINVTFGLFCYRFIILIKAIASHYSNVSEFEFL